VEERSLDGLRLRGECAQCLSASFTLLNLYHEGAADLRDRQVGVERVEAVVLVEFVALQHRSKEVANRCRGLDGLNVVSEARLRFGAGVIGARKCAFKFSECEFELCPELIHGQRARVRAALNVREGIDGSRRRCRLLRRRRGCHRRCVRRASERCSAAKNQYYACDQEPTHVRPSVWILCLSEPKPSLIYANTIERTVSHVKFAHEIY